MMRIDEEAWICDMAETYHIFDVWSLPVKMVATLSAGLRDDSRIKMKIRGESTPLNIILLASIRDGLTDITAGLGLYGKKKRPEPLLPIILGSEKEKTKDKVMSFSSAEDFKKELRRIRGECDG